MSGLVHAGTLLAVVLVAAPLARHIPMATLAAVLFVVAWNMGEWFEIPGVVRLGKTDRVVWLVTLALTVLADLTVAVEVGMVLAALLYVYRVSETSSVSIVTPEYIEEGQMHSLQLQDVPPYVSILRIHGPFLFGTTDKLALATRDLSQLAADRDRPAAEHDGHRRHGPLRAGVAGGPTRAVGTAPVAVRRARPAGTHAAPGQLRPPHRRRQHHAERPARAEAREGDSRASAA